MHTAPTLSSSIGKKSQRSTQDEFVQDTYSTDPFELDRQEIATRIFHVPAGVGHAMFGASLPFIYFRGGKELGHL